jgi:hypothetical protein
MVRTLASVSLALASMLLSAGPALAAHTVTGFTVTPASTQAGASVNASSSTSLSYSNTTDDVKKTIGHFAPGLLANPEAVPHCPQALYLADACPADTRIGEAEGDIQAFPAPAVTEHGRIYNQELLEDEGGRLGIILDTAPSKTFLTAPFYVRSNGDYGLDGILDNISRVAPGLQITRLSFTLYGQVNGRNYTRAPTSCALHTSSGEAYAYDHPEPAFGPSDSYTPTGCDKLPFKPGFTMSVGARGSNEFGTHPALSVTVTQQPGESGIFGNTVTLPQELTPNTAAFGSICSAAQLAANACPAGSQVGTTTATSTFVATPLSGPVYLVQQAGSVLPALVADLRGRVAVRITIGTSIIGGKQIKSTVTNVPDLPISTFTLKLNGGSKGVLTAKSDLCYSSDSRTGFRSLQTPITFAGQNGANIKSSPRIEVEGCGPSVVASLRRAGRRKPRFSAVINRHPDEESIKRAELELPRTLSLVRRKVRRGVSGQASGKLSRGSFQVAGRRKLVVTNLPSAGVRTLVVRLGRGVVKVKRSLRRRVRRGSKPKLRFKLITVDTTGERFETRSSLRARR